MSEQTSDSATLRRLMMYFVVFCAVALLAGASRMRPPAWQLQTFGDILRIREALSMFVFAPALGLLFWLMTRAVAGGRPHPVVEALMVLAIYFVACGMGIHDPTNRMWICYAGKKALSPAARQTLQYLDDGLGHWVFWGGFILGSWVFGLQQLLTPLRQGMRRHWLCGFGVVTLLLLGVMLTNLWNEYPKTRADLCVIAAAVAVPLLFHVLARRKVSLKRLPALVVIYPAYLGAIGGTLACWLIRYGKV